MIEKKEIKVFPQVTQIEPNFRKYYENENREARLDRMEEDIEYLKAELSGVRKMDEDIETLFVRTLGFEDLITIIAEIDERLAEIEELVSFRDTLDIMRKEQKEKIMRERTFKDGFIDLHLRDEVLIKEEKV